jgi:hypothetical protein
VVFYGLLAVFPAITALVSLYGLFATNCATVTDAHSDLARLALGVSRGGFYAWLTRPCSRRSRSDEEVGAKVRASFLASDRTYGARRVWHDMLAEGVSCDCIGSSG